MQIDTMHHAYNVDVLFIYIVRSSALCWLFKSKYWGRGLFIIFCVVIVIIVVSGQIF